MLDRLTSGTPLTISETTLSSARANALGHLAAAQYVVLFDEVFMAFVTGVGLTDASLRHGDTTPVLADLHACYLKEVKPGDDVQFDVLVVSMDQKRLRLMLRMKRAGLTCATCELAIINFAPAVGRPTPWSAEQVAILERIAAAHRTAPMPSQVGRSAGPPVGDSN